MKSLISQTVSLMHGAGGKSDLRMLGRYLGLLAAIIILYSAAFHALMLMEGRQYSWITGVYWTLTVMSTLGFGDITFSSDLGRAFSVVVLLSGILSLLVVLPFAFIHFFYAPWLEAQNRARAPRRLPPGTRGHVILTHFNNSAANLVGRLRQLGIPAVVLVPDFRQALELFDRGYQVVVGELNNPDTYRDLQVHQAALVVVLNNDLASTNIIYTIRERCEHVVTVTNADQDDSLDILELAGSTHVFQFHKLLGRAMARRVLGTSLEPNVIGRFGALRIAEVPAACLARRGPNNTVVGSTSSSKGTRWGDSRNWYGIFNTILPPNSPSCGSERNALISASSYHPGGVNVAMADGSVTFISDTIDAGDPTKFSGEGMPGFTVGSPQRYTGPSTYGVWGALGTRAGGEAAALP